MNVYSVEAWDVVVRELKQALRLKEAQFVLKSFLVKHILIGRCIIPPLDASFSLYPFAFLPFGGVVFCLLS